MSLRYKQKSEVRRVLPSEAGRRRGTSLPSTDRAELIINLPRPADPTSRPMARGAATRPNWSTPQNRLFEDLIAQTKINPHNLDGEKCWEESLRYFKDFCTQTPAGKKAAIKRLRSKKRAWVARQTQHRGQQGQQPPAGGEYFFVLLSPYLCPF